MTHSKLILAAFSFVLASTTMASAKCDSTEKGVTHKIKGKTYICDTCVTTGCDASGKTLDKCARKTDYLNCVEPTEKSEKKPDEKKKPDTATKDKKSDATTNDKKK